ncbi:Rne/Rng family ribonuclease [Devosia sp.]|uniref:Rne/Rng family ribonuclease n=1 Tax=Devosia sp. TaxID=1871048 RepID=UPI003A8F6274
MATKRMLVDAIHPEETRIVVTSGNKLEEFDFESASRRQLRGNIYLAKVTRVEPSLQAAFVEYGGNRHGFLAFSEIHPDYYQIPVADREALLREDAAQESDESADSSNAPAEAGAEADPQSTEPDESDDGSHVEQAPSNSEPVEQVGGSDALEDIQERRRPNVRSRHYKIQEVIKRRQVMLVQVVKEERGNKGAALTTYLSLAGRYSVLMPNTARGGGISRKITNAADRKRLKDIVGDLDVPQGQGIILRTAGASRTKAEVKRDFEYLQRLWENVRALTLKSQAPCLVYEEGSLIKRTIRDLYSKEIDELLVAGDEAYREAKDFMRMIMPSHAKNVQAFKEDQPIFSKFNVEPQLDQMFSPQVTLPSGGYLVINPTEALVSIDVNSGRSTKEHNIEDTALQTNLEAAEEVARQLRLRDLAGLIVIDFIDMSENRANRAVERKLKDALKNDRARIQVGRISHFGLMEMSRQRIRFGVVESSTHKCPTCSGTGLVRSVESLALMVMRQVEDHVLKKPGASINLRVPTDVALYMLNSKRNTLIALEVKYELSITIVADDHVGPTHFAIERGEARVNDRLPTAGTHVRVDTTVLEDADDDIEDDTADETENAAASNDESGERGGRRRRRRRRGGDREDRPQQAAAETTDADGVAAESAASGSNEDDSGDTPSADGEEPRRRRRRGRRGGRRNRRPEDGQSETQAETQAQPNESGDQAADEAVAETPPAESTMPDADAVETVAEAVLAQDAIAEASGVDLDKPAEPVAEAPVEKPKRGRRKKAEPAAEVSTETAPSPEASADAAAEAEAPPAKPKRTRTRKPKAATPPTEEAAVASAEKLDSVTEPAETPAPAAAEPVVTEDSAPVAEPEAEKAETPKPRRRSRKEIPDGEIVVSSAKETEAEAEAPKPKKAGWWQRRLGLG